MRRREFIGIIGTLPFLISLTPYKDPPPLSAKGPIIEVLREQFKYDDCYYWMADNIPDPYIGDHSTHPTAIIVKDNVITVRVMSNIYDLNKMVEQRDDLVELVTITLSDIKWDDLYDRGIAIDRLSLGPPKFKEIHGEFLHYQHIIVSYKDVSTHRTHTKDEKK